MKLAPGFAYFPTSKMGLEFSFIGFSYHKTSVKSDDADYDFPETIWEEKAFGINLLAPMLGIQFYF